MLLFFAGARVLLSCPWARSLLEPAFTDTMQSFRIVAVYLKVVLKVIVLRIAGEPGINIHVFDICFKLSLYVEDRAIAFYFQQIAHGLIRFLCPDPLHAANDLHVVAIAQCFEKRTVFKVAFQ